MVDVDLVRPLKRDAPDRGIGVQPAKRILREIILIGVDLEDGAVRGAGAVAAATPQTGRALFDAVLDLTPGTYVRKGLRRARTLSGSTIEQAAAVLGNGSRISAQDTVPFALWAAARYHRDYPAAIRACVRAGGDMDTTAAITGGIVATQTGPEGIPSTWLLTREPLPAWIG